MNSPTRKSGSTGVIYHLSGLPDRKLSSTIAAENAVLEYFRIQTIKCRSRPKRRLWKKVHTLQFNFVRALYQQTDEYRSTRGY